MALTVGEVDRILRAIHRAYCDYRHLFGSVLDIRWLKDQVRTEITNVSAFFDTNDTTINNQFSAGFRDSAVSSVADRIFIVACIIVARLKKNSPTHFQIFRAMLNDIGKDT